MMNQPESFRHSSVTLPAIGSDGIDKGGDLIAQLNEKGTVAHNAVLWFLITHCYLLI
jgi:hypothetical protein